MWVIFNQSNKSGFGVAEETCDVRPNEGHAAAAAAAAEQLPGVNLC